MSYPYQVRVEFRHGQTDEVAGFHRDDDARAFIDMLAKNTDWITGGALVLVNSQTSQTIHRQTVKGKDNYTIDPVIILPKPQRFEYILAKLWEIDEPQRVLVSIGGDMSNTEDFEYDEMVYFYFADDEELQSSFEPNWGGEFGHFYTLDILEGESEELNA
jgi:hypothetical protein